jgi:hypothetical protein
MFAQLLRKVALGTASTYRNLTLTPIVLSGGPLSSLDPSSLEVAIARGCIRVKEVSAEGHVPELFVENSGSEPVLILDGEELVGAKQNRIVNVTILVPPRSNIVIPVSCMEAGRWGYSRPNFTVPGRVLNQDIRYRKAEAVTRNLKSGKPRFANQADVWKGVSLALSALGTASFTSALSDAFEGRLNAINDYVAAFPSQAQQVGVIYRIGEVLAGLDLFGSERAFTMASPKLVRGAALQALAGYRNRQTTLSEKSLLEGALAINGDRFAGVGLGEEVRFDTAEFGGGALLLDGELIHLFAFPRSPELPQWSDR